MTDLYTDRKGSFVYLVLHKTVQPRVQPSPHAEYSSAQRFHPGDMVSVDVIRTPDPEKLEDSSTSSCSQLELLAFTTTFLRLSDGSGWLPQSSPGQVHLQQVTNEVGFWKFYIDNHPVGQALRRHPIDSAQVHAMQTEYYDDNSDAVDEVAPSSRNGAVIYAPMRLVHCDRCVVHPTTGVRWYRVQGVHDSDGGWIMDRRLQSPLGMLVPASRVRTGLFAFVALQSVGIRSRCGTGTDCMTLHTVQQGQVVTVDIIRSWPSLGESLPYVDDDSDTENQATGPFLRLTDGSGWVFVRKEGTEVMRQVPLSAVQAQLVVLHPPEGLSLRRFPMDDAEKTIGQTESYSPGTLLQADIQVTDLDGVRFYRVVGTDGWLCDRRDGVPTIKVLNEGEPVDDDVSSKCSLASAIVDDKIKAGWSTDFVRGVASTSDRVQEVEYHPNSQVLCFETVGQQRIDVYCNTRTIGIKSSGQPYIWYRNCSPKELWGCLSRDLEDMVMKMRLTSEENEEVTVSLSDAAMDAKSSKALEEDEIRNHILRIDKEIEELQEKRLDYIRQIKTFDRERAVAAEAMTKLIEKRKSEHENLVLAQEATYGHEVVYDPNGLKDAPSVSGSKYSRRNWATYSSPRPFSTRSNTTQQVQKRIEALLELRSNETDDIFSDATSHRSGPVLDDSASTDDDEMQSNFNSNSFDDASSEFDGSYTDTEVESQ